MQGGASDPIFTGGNNPRTYQCHAAGRTTAISRPGMVTNTFAYNTLATTGTPTSPFHHAGPYRYQSDPDHNLQLLGHRYYDPSTGRFLTRDPIKDGRNWYAYEAG